MLTFNKRRTMSKGRATRRRPCLEALEGRVVLSTFTVNTFNDTVALKPSAGPFDKNHDISLRSAIMAADAHPAAADTIILPGGTYTLTIPPANGDGSANGDFDISANLTINGSTTEKTVINGNSLDRVFHVLSGRVAISNVVIENGRAVGVGGGILNSGGTVTLTSVQLVDNVAAGAAGATGAPGADRFPVGTNGSPGGAGGAGEGGAILNQVGSLTLNNCVISANEAIGGAGGNGGDGGFGGPLEGIVRADAGPVDGVGGAGASGGHGGAGEGGGVFNAAGASLILSGDTFSNDHAIGGAGGVGGEGGDAQGESQGLGSAGGSGTGGAGGAGGTGGLGAGAGLFNLGKVTLSGASTEFNGNQAKGGIGGTSGAGGAGSGFVGGEGVLNGDGEPGGAATGGAGGAGGQGGTGEGGAIFNGTGASISSTTAVLIVSNSALGNLGGAGGAGGQATGGAGGDGTSIDTSGVFTGDGGAGGEAIPGNGGKGGTGGLGEGGGLFDADGGTVTFKAGSITSSQGANTFAMNRATGGGGGNGGAAGSATGGTGGNAGFDPADGGPGGLVVGGTGGNGGAGGEGSGGGLYDDGTASFTAVTVNFNNNEASGGSGAVAGSGGSVQGGTGGTGTGAAGGQGGAPTGGNGGSGGDSGAAKGGGIIVDVSGSLVLRPRTGIKPLPPGHGPTDIVTSNSAIAGGVGGAGLAGSATAGTGGTGSPDGNTGMVTAGHAGVIGTLKQSEGGGIAIFGTATGDNTTVTGNHANKFPNIEGKLAT